MQDRKFFQVGLEMTMENKRETLKYWHQMEQTISKANYIQNWCLFRSNKIMLTIKLPLTEHLPCASAWSRHPRGVSPASFTTSSEQCEGSLITPFDTSGASRASVGELTCRKAHNLEVGRAQS